MLSDQIQCFSVCLIMWYMPTSVFSAVKSSSRLVGQGMINVCFSNIQSGRKELFADYIFLPFVL